MKGIDIGEEGARRLGKVVKDAREGRGLTQPELVERSGGAFTVSTLQVVERGVRSRLAPKTLRGLAKALEWTEESPGRVVEGLDPVPLEQYDDVWAALDQIRSGLGQLERGLASRGSRPAGPSAF